MKIIVQSPLHGFKYSLFLTHILIILPDNSLLPQLQSQVELVLNIKQTKSHHMQFYVESP
jgi:hypothetical protein